MPFTPLLRVTICRHSREHPMDTLQNMRAFSCVAEAGSFTAAAAQLDTTTANISRAVSNLEAHLQTRLLNRTTRRIALTEAGKRYLLRCEQILAYVEEAEAEASDAHARPSGQLKVHTMTGIGQHFVIDAIARYRRTHPDVTFDLTLANRVPDLLDHACLRLVSPVVLLDKWSFNGPDGQESVAINTSPFLVNSADAMKTAITSGMGVGLLPVYAAIEGLRNGTLVRVMPNYRSQELNLYAIYPSRQYLDAKIKTWVEYLRGSLPEILAAHQAELVAYELSGSLGGVRMAN